MLLGNSQLQLTAASIRCGFTLGRLRYVELCWLRWQVIGEELAKLFGVFRRKPAHQTNIEDEFSDASRVGQSAQLSMERKLNVHLLLQHGCTCPLNHDYVSTYAAFQFGVDY
jgi:hypothetical protein